QGQCIAKERNLLPLEIETNVTQVIKFINEGSITYDSIIYSCRLLLLQMGTVVIQHNVRQGNEVAHLLTKHARSLSTFNNIELLFLPPPFVMTRMLTDKCANIGNQHAMHGLSTTINDPQDHTYCNS
ncbi:hypothetical protein A4A49_64747, partial [Nicotiana attenuata]